MSTAGIHFRKMNGIGNDFVVIDTRHHALALTPAIAQAIADRDHGIGCDQLITIEPPRKVADADGFMGIWNPDGSEVGACGNATRCVGQILLDETGKDEVVIETLRGRLTCARAPGGLFTADMGAPRLLAGEIPLSAPVPDTQAVDLSPALAEAPDLPPFAAVNMGNPHAVFFIEDFTRFAPGVLGPLLERHPMFPERANISFARVDDREHITLHVWERGAGLTLACGSAACATAVAAIRLGLTERKVTIALPGGALTIEWPGGDAHVFMTGPTALEFEGELDDRLLAGAAA
ncbi:MAG: diaminopimelate epimerase [Parvibaculaceae bacterium]|nr:diaminopimelate epimerase [Parvibaculaceae bacterium]